jgi:glycosyltransferase involved in cell wall biosynthesis
VIDTARPLRFCHLTTFYPPHSFGGDAIGIQRLARGLARRGHDVTVVYDMDAFMALHRGPEPALPPETDGVRVIRMRSRLGALSPLMTQQFGRPVVHGRAIERVLESGAFDVINFHNISLLGGPGLLALGGGVKVYMAHEHWLVCPSHVLWRHNREPCAGRQCLRCVAAFRRPPQLWRYTGRLEQALSAVDVFIAMSDFSRRKHQEFGFTPPMDVLPYFLPDPDGEPMSSSDAEPSPHARPYFLFVGRLEKIKGLDTIIPVFRHYNAADLLVVGDGAQAAELRELARDLPHVRFVGRLAPEALARFYRHAIALIVPSVGFETFGIVLIEAFRGGAPVIARRLGPFPEIVNLARAGELFSTVEELVAAMRSLQEDPERRATFVRNGYEAYRRYWTESAVIPRYLDIIYSAAGRRGGRGIAGAPAGTAVAGT